MSRLVDKAWKIGLAFTVLILWVDAGTVDEAKAYLPKTLGERRHYKRSVREESSSESEERVDDKPKEKKENVQRDRESDSDNDSSDSDGNRRISTKGLVPDDFEPERNPRIHERYSKDSDSE